MSPSSLKKMTVGMFLASMAFVVAAIVQVEIDVSCPDSPGAFPAGRVGHSEGVFLRDRREARG